LSANEAEAELPAWSVQVAPSDAPNALIRGMPVAWTESYAVRVRLRLAADPVPVPAIEVESGPSGEGHVRCSYATALPLLEEALERMARFLASVSG